MYYRKNKFNESVEVHKYECGSCRNYDFQLMKQFHDMFCWYVMWNRLLNSSGMSNRLI